MHEFSLMNDLVRKIKAIAKENKAKAITKVKVQLGEFCHISPEHFREHFVQATQDTIARGAALEIDFLSDRNSPHINEILLQSVDILEHEETLTSG